MLLRIVEQPVEGLIFCAVIVSLLYIQLYSPNGRRQNNKIYMDFLSGFVVGLQVVVQEIQKSTTIPQQAGCTTIHNIIE